MTKKEIIKQTLLHKKTPEMPYYMKFAASVYAKLQEHFAVKDVGKAVGNYITSFTPGYGRDFKRGELPGNLYYDEFGCLWQGTEANLGQIKEPVLKSASLKDYRFPDAGDTNRLKGLQELRRNCPDTYLIVNLESHTLLERAFNLRGMAQLMMDMYDHGNIADIIPDIIDIGITAINPMQPEVMDIFALKRKFGNEVTFFGGMNTQDTMPFGTVAEVTSEMRKLVRELGREGGFILAPGIIVQEDVPRENVLTFIQICREQAF